MTVEESVEVDLISFCSFLHEPKENPKNKAIAGSSKYFVTLVRYGWLTIQVTGYLLYESILHYVIGIQSKDCIHKNTTFLLK